MLGTPRSRLSAGSGRLKRRLRAELPALQGDATQIDPLPEFAFVNPAGLAGLHAACLRSGPLFGVAAENCRRPPTTAYFAASCFFSSFFSSFLSSGGRRGLRGTGLALAISMYVRMMRSFCSGSRIRLRRLPLPERLKQPSLGCTAYSIAAIAHDGASYGIAW